MAVYGVWWLHSRCWEVLEDEAGRSFTQFALGIKGHLCCCMLTRYEKSLCYTAVSRKYLIDWNLPVRDRLLFSWSLFGSADEGPSSIILFEVAYCCLHRPLQCNSLVLSTRSPSLEAFVSQTSYLIVHAGGTYLSRTTIYWLFHVPCAGNLWKRVESYNHLFWYM